MVGELTARELKTLELLADGKTNEQIAAVLKVKSTTIETYVRILREKMHAENRTHAVAIALRNGLIE